MSDQSTSSYHYQQYLAGGGEMGKLAREFDCALTAPWATVVFLVYYTDRGRVDFLPSLRGTKQSLHRTFMQIDVVPNELYGFDLQVQRLLRSSQ